KSHAQEYSNGVQSEQTDFSSRRERNSEAYRRSPREGGPIARRVDAEVDAYQADAGADAEVLDHFRQAVDTCAPCGVSKRDERISHKWQLDLLDRDHVVASNEEQVISAQGEKVDGGERPGSAEIAEPLWWRDDTGSSKDGVAGKCERLRPEGWK